MSSAVARSYPTLDARPARLKSPLRYPGGKSRGVSVILKYIPKGIGKLCSPFLGGASVELACAEAGIRIHGSDAYEPLINFWRNILLNPIELADQIQKHYPLSKQKFYKFQQDYHSYGSDFEKAAIFYILNRSSFSGTTLSGGMSPGHPRFTVSAIERVRKFKADNFKIECMDYRQALAKHSDVFLYLDPPYANSERLYGTRGDMHLGFNHEELADELKQRSGWVLSYNNSEFVRHLYKGFTILEPEWTYGMANSKRSRELLIINV